MGLGLGSEHPGTNSVAAAGRTGYIARCSVETTAGTGPGRRRVAGSESGWAEGREEGRSGSLGLGFGLVATGSGSLIVGRRGCWRWTVSCSFAGLGEGAGCRGRDQPMGCRRWWVGWT